MKVFILLFLSFPFLSIAQGNELLVTPLTIHKTPLIEHATISKHKKDYSFLFTVNKEIALKEFKEPLFSYLGSGNLTLTLSPYKITEEAFEYEVGISENFIKDSYILFLRSSKSKNKEAVFLRLENFFAHPKSAKRPASSANKSRTNSD